MVATPSRLPTRTVSAEQVSGRSVAVSGNSLSQVKAAASLYSQQRPKDRRTDRTQIAQRWQVEMYRHVNICGEARYAVMLFAHIAARAEIGISEGTALGRKAVWVDTGPEVEVLAELAPTVRERKKLIRDFMTHWCIAGECYLIARTRAETDVDPTNPEPIWEIVSVTDLRRGTGDTWEVRHDNDEYIALASDDPVIRLWNPDPSKRREAWSPMRSMETTLREIEFLTSHIFTQVRSRLMSAGVWFLPNNLTFAPPPVEAVEGGQEAIDAMNEAEQFMVSLAASSMQMLEGDEVAFPTVVMSDDAALANIDQNKLIKFWSEIDDKAMTLRDAAVRRFALGWDLPPEQVLGASGLAVGGSGGSAGSVNHWGVWANEEQTIANHIEPALDEFVAVLTTAVVRRVVLRTTKMVAYDTATLRLRQDRSKESIELYDRGQLKGEVMLRENGFDPEHDQMDDMEWRRWMLTRIAGGSATPEQVQAAIAMLGIVLPVATPAPSATPALPAPGKPGRNEPRNLDEHPYEGPPREQHDHSPAPFGALHAGCEVLVLRALEKAGNRLLNDGKRGRDRDRSTPAHLAHLSLAPSHPYEGGDFDFSLLPTVLGDRSAIEQARIGGALARFCAGLYRDGVGYDREDLIAVLEEF